MNSRLLTRTAIDAIPPQPEDAAQLLGYVAGLRRKYPEANIARRVICCIGNRAWRVFDGAGDKSGLSKNDLWETVFLPEKQPPQKRVVRAWDW